jgi:hypothetical protein
MKYKLTFHPLLDSEVQEIISYYNSKREGLGLEFFEELQSKYRTLKTNPLFQKRYNDIHCLPLKRFPYMVHFSVDKKSKTVFIEAVYGTAQDSKIWKR